MGTFAVQIARYFGAEVTGVDKSSKLDMLRSIGADHVIDYEQEDYSRSGQQYDLILDVAAYRSVFEYRHTLTPEGRFMMVGGSLASLLQVVFIGTLISRFESRKIGLNAWEPNKREDLALLAKLFESGEVVPVIDKRYPLSEVPEALRYLAGGQVLGKLIINT
jgi:NADPH:quinone reductase-like Zn-dependent oxidoreductase